MKWEVPEIRSIMEVGLLKLAIGYCGDCDPYGGGEHGHGPGHGHGHRFQDQKPYEKLLDW